MAADTTGIANGEVCATDKPHESAYAAIDLTCLNGEQLELYRSLSINHDPKTNLPNLLANLPVDAIDVVKNGRFKNRVDFSVRGSDSLNFEGLAKFFAEGWTIIVRSYDLYNEHVANACGKLNLGRKLTSHFANLYISPPYGRALKPHYDTHDVAIVQGYGNKYWAVSDVSQSVTPYSFEDIPTAPPSSSYRHSLVTNASKPFKIERGTFHFAEATTTGSVHLTFGSYRLHYLDILARALGAIVEQNISGDVRRRLPTLLIDSLGNDKNFAPPKRSEVYRYDRAIFPHITTDMFGVASSDGLDYLRRNFQHKEVSSECPSDEALSDLIAAIEVAFGL